MEAADTGETQGNNNIKRSGTADKEPLGIDDMSDDGAGAEYLLAGLKGDGWGDDMTDDCLGEVSRSPDFDSDGAAAPAGSSVRRQEILPLSKVGGPAEPMLQDTAAGAQLGSLSPDENAFSNGHGET